MGDRKISVEALLPHWLVEDGSVPRVGEGLRAELYLEAVGSARYGVTGADMGTPLEGVIAEQDGPAAKVKFPHFEAINYDGSTGPFYFSVSSETGWYQDCVYSWHISAVFLHRSSHLEGIGWERASGRVRVGQLRRAGPGKVVLTDPIRIDPTAGGEGNPT